MCLRKHKLLYLWPHWINSEASSATGHQMKTKSNEKRPGTTCTHRLLPITTQLAGPIQNLTVPKPKKGSVCGYYYFLFAWPIQNPTVPEQKKGSVCGYYYLLLAGGCGSMITYPLWLQFTMELNSFHWPTWRILTVRNTFWRLTFNVQCARSFWHKLLRNVMHCSAAIWYVAKHKVGRPQII